MLKFIKSFFKKPEPVAETQPAVPYKVDAKVEFVPAPVVEQATEAMVESIAPAEKPAKKKPAAKKAPAVKKPRAPKKPKAE
jgi:hypothetical protein